MNCLIIPEYMNRLRLGGNPSPLETKKPAAENIRGGFLKLSGMIISWEWPLWE
jgi:hypothetical protein